LEGFSCHHEALREALQGKWDGEERERERGGCLSTIYVPLEEEGGDSEKKREESKCASFSRALHIREERKRQISINRFH
jgi:hypothetical protein